MKLINVATLIIFLFFGFNSFAQKYDKPLRKIKSSYSEGSYTKSFSRSTRLVKKLEKTKKKSPQALENALLYRAKNIEVLNKYTQLDEAFNKYLKTVEHNHGPASLAFSKANLNVAEIYLDYGYGFKADSLINQAILIMKDSVAQLSSKENLHLSYLKYRALSLNGFYNEAIDTLSTHLPKLKAEAEVPYKTLKKTLGKSAKQEAHERKIIFGSWQNALIKVFIQKGDLRKADSLTAINKTWLRKNLDKDELPYYENIFLTGLLFDYTSNKRASISNMQSALKMAKKEHKRAHRFTLDIQETLLYTYLKNDYKGKKFKKKLKKFRKTIARNYTKKSSNYLRYLSVRTQRDILEEKIKGSEKKFGEYLKSDFLPAIHPLRIQMLNQIVSVNLVNNHYKEAEARLEEISKISLQLNGAQSPVYYLTQTIYANHLIEYSNNFHQVGDIYKKGFFGILENELHPFHKNFVPTLNNLAIYYELNDQFKEAEQTLEKAKSITSAKFKKENTIYGAELQKIAAIQIKLGDYNKASENLERAVELLERYNDKTIRDYAKTLDTYAKLLMLKGMYDEAIDKVKKSTKLFNKSRVGKTKVIVTNMDELAQIYIQQGKYSETEKNLKTLLKDKETLYGTDHRILIPTLNQLAYLYTIKGDYTLAEKLIDRSKAITNKVFGENSTKICPALMVESEILTSLGDYEKASELINQVIKISSARLGDKHIEIAAPLSKLATLGLYTNKKLEDLEEDLSKAKTIFYHKLGSKNPSYAQALVDLANLQIHQKKYDYALANLNDANKIFIEDLGKGNTLSSANIYIAIGDIYVRQKNFDKAKDNYNKAKKIYDKVLNDQHPNYVKILSKLSKMYYLMGNFEESKRQMDKVLENYSNYVDQYFSTLSENEKTKFWNMIRPDYEFYNSLALSMIKSHPEVSQNLYNNALLTKSLLLNASQKIRERIFNSNDEELKTKYFDWIEKKETLANISSFTTEELEKDSIDPKKIYAEVETLEKELSAKSELFKQSYEKEKIDWKKIQQSLKPEEVAIEVVRFRYFKESFEDSVIYSALVLKPNTSEPEMVILKDGNQLENNYLKLYRNSIKFKIEDSYSYQNYWKPIKSKVGTARRIYLSPDGVYNQINMETLLTDNGEFVLDQDNIVLVNNTKDLYLAKISTDQPLDTKSVSIFGNPSFYTENSRETVISQLPGTEIESKELTNLLKENGWESHTYLSEEASEDNLKQLNNPRIFHIATHGFFMPDQESENSSQSEERILLNPLFRSGLMLKGAGDLISEDYSISKINRESGILTAYEAMNLNFDNTDLVVLSACETGLGEITVGEGVYGLQRAFLVAGAKSLIMSLFKVSDEATQKLMVSFYKKWLETGNKRDSFIMAKRELRKEYADPIYWGSFVMVGIN